MKCSIDFETRSAVDLKVHGAYRYAMDPSTGIYVMSWAFGDEIVTHWLPGEPFPERVHQHAKDGGIFTAWNAQFERLIWWYILSDMIPQLAEPHLEQFECTAARARAHGMPGKLGDAARAMNAEIAKMSEGARLIREYCANNVLWENIPRDDQDLMCAYCDTDVATERGLGTMLRELSADEWYEFHLNEHINDLGVPLDMTFARKAAGLADHVRDEADRKIFELTGGRVKTARQRKTRDEWLLGDTGLLTPEQQEMLEVGTSKDQQKFSFDETHRSELMATVDLHPDARQYFEYVIEGGGSTMRKYRAMNDKSIDARLHGALLFNGAGQTGRFSSMGLQVHNLSRSTVDNPEEEMAKDVLDHTTLKKLVRACIYLPDAGLTWYDWSNIEGRVAPWLEGTELGEAKIQLYIDGVDPYVYNASKTFNIPMDQVTKDQRQAGKLQELALQFLGGVGALKMMGINYGITITDTQGQHYRDSWREANPWAMSLGVKMNRAALRAIQRPRTWFEAGRVRFITDGGNWLWMELPSGRLLAYHRPRIERVMTPWDEEITAVTCVWGSGKPKVGEPWPRRQMHGGIWIENATQATAADVLREAIVRVDDGGLDIVLHIHDEVIVEGDCLEELSRLMLISPTWATGLPIVGEGGSDCRYGK